MLMHGRVPQQMNAVLGEEGGMESELPVSTADLGPHLESFRPRLKRMVSLRLDPRLRRRVDSSDVLQETFAVATQRFAEYRGSPVVPFYVWVRQLAFQKLLDAQRRHLGAARRDVRREVAENEPEPEGTSASLARALIDAGPTPSEAVARKEQEQQLQAALDGMKEVDREILLLRYFERLSNEECACALGISISAAKLRHLRAAKRLREILGTRTGLSEDLLGS